MIVQRRGPGTGGDVQAIPVAHGSANYSMPVTSSRRVNQGPVILIAGIGIAILLLAFYYLLPQSVQRYLSAA